MSAVFWFTWITGGVIILILAALFLVVWIANEYFSLPGNPDVTQGLIGKIGTVKVECTPHQRGKVYVMGAYWDAISQFGVLHVGKDIQVVEVREKFLVVRPIDLVTREDGSEPTTGQGLG